MVLDTSGCEIAALDQKNVLSVQEIIRLTGINAELVGVVKGWEKCALMFLLDMQTAKAIIKQTLLDARQDKKQKFRSAKIKPWRKTYHQHQSLVKTKTQ